MVKQNLGKVDRILRFALAFWWLGPFAPQVSLVWVNWLFAFVGVVALIESFLGWCKLHDMLHVNNKNQ